MFKLFWKDVIKDRQVSKDWRHDPMGHPALHDMGLLELADLPMVAEIPLRAPQTEIGAACGQRIAPTQPVACCLSR